ncbi:MAG TPA: alpha/beta hydrolase [Bacteroidia bacterium]|nr:alpha/beta hydrolase [Bacteroidia bacterium]
MTTPKTILFIHGMFMNSSCWDDWMRFFSGKGYSCLAPSWPGHEGSVKELREKHPSASLEKLTLGDVVRFFEEKINGLPGKPVLIGHSMGGLAVQLLLNRGLASAGIAVDPAPPKGVFSFKWSFLKSNLPVVNPLKGNRPDLMSLKRFRYAFVNGMSESEQENAWTRYVVPESRNVPRSSTKNDGKADFRKAHDPLLIIAGGNDHIIPPSLNRKNFEKYKAVGSVTEFKEFPGRNHFTIGQPGWEEVADFCEKWINRNVK